MDVATDVLTYWVRADMPGSCWVERVHSRSLLKKKCSDARAA